MVTVRLDIVDAEFCRHFRRKLDEVHSAQTKVAVAIRGAVDVCAKGIRSHRHSITRRIRKVNGGFACAVAATLCASRLIIAPAVSGGSFSRMERRVSVSMLGLRCGRLATA